MLGSFLETNCFIIITIFNKNAIDKVVNFSLYLSYELIIPEAQKTLLKLRI